MQFKSILAFALLTLAGCDEPSAPANNSEFTTTAPVARAAIYKDAVKHPGRTDADRERDAGRKPGKVLAFFAIEPGMTVLDMFSGGGYYTEMLSRIVGPNGKIVAHTNSAYAGFVGEEATNRYANNRLANVENLLAENNELDLPAARFDAVMLVLAYHDIYFVDDANGWPEIDGPQFLAQLKKSLKPGAMLAVVDHYAAPGSPAETGGSLHRIDKQIVIDELNAAGFVLEGESNELRNLDDDHSLGMFDPEIRGKTDRFVLKFRLPE